MRIALNKTRLGAVAILALALLPCLVTCYQEGIRATYPFAVAMTVFGFNGYGLWLMGKGQIKRGQANILFAMGVLLSAILARFLLLPQ
jgi:hypothetical protein